MRKLAIPLLAGLCLAPLATAQDAPAVSPELRSSILELQEIVGSQQIGVQMASAMAQHVASRLRQGYPDLPERAIEILQEVTLEVFQSNFDGLTERSVAIYARHLTPEDVRGLIAFYRTPLGEKALGAIPAIMGESLAASRAWAEELQPTLEARLLDQLKAEGLLPASAASLDAPAGPVEPPPPQP